LYEQKPYWGQTHTQTPNVTLNPLKIMVLFTFKLLSKSQQNPGTKGK